MVMANSIYNKKNSPPWGNLWYSRDIAKFWVNNVKTTTITTSMNSGDIERIYFVNISNYKVQQPWKSSFKEALFNYWF